ncbi:MAG: phosphoglycerate mutase family protein [Syntrophales bacterium]|nr:phosphoglycerate mutase family protein [Syntrophales bacterium]
MSKICMVRHGQASFGKDNYDQLSEKGRKQCGILAEHFIRTGLSFDAVYSGNMIRQQNTALEIISIYRTWGYASPEMRIFSEFDEYSSREIILSHIHDIVRDDPSLKADMDNFYTDKKAFQRVFEKIMMRWISGKNDKPGIIRWRDFRKQVQTGFRKVMVENGRKKNILICTSGGPISAAMQMALGLSDEKTLRTAWHIINTSVTTFIYDNNRVALTNFNNATHLELLNDSEWITYR